MDVQQIFNYLVENYGIYAVFLLCTVEGDITLLLAGILAKTNSFGEFSYLQVLFFGTLGAVAGDSFGYFLGRYFQTTVNKFSYYRSAAPRIEMLQRKFGALSIFVSKYIYGIRAAWCIFYGTSGVPVWKFLLHDVISCFLWVLLTSGVGYIFGAVVMNLIGDFHNVGVALLFIVVALVLGFYLFERFWLAKKVETADSCDSSALSLSSGTDKRLTMFASSKTTTRKFFRLASTPICFLFASDSEIINLIYRKKLKPVWKMKIILFDGCFSPQIYTDFSR